MRKPYPTDLSDAEWSYIEPHLPAPTGQGRPRTHSLREILNAVFYAHPPQALGPLLPDEPVSRSFDRPDLQALAHFRNCYSTEQVPQPYFSPLFPQHPYEGAFACFACMVAESYRSCMRTSEPNSMLNF